MYLNKKAKKQLVEDEQQRLLEEYYATLDTTTETVQTTEPTIAMTHVFDDELTAGKWQYDRAVFQSLLIVRDDRERK